MAPLVHRIILADSRQMPELADESVHLVVTSPPYWQLKDYAVQGQIGFHEDYPQYIASLNRVWSECYRVLRPGCRLCVNVGDQFARATHYGRYKVIPIRTEIIAYCESIGFDYMGAIIWQKRTTCNTSGGAVIMGSYPYPRNGIVKIDYEFILLFKKPGEPAKVPPEVRQAAKLSRQDWNTFFYGHWYFKGERQREHVAAFPDELPRRLIRMFSFPGETVLDPFLGSGTTMKVALELGRASIGYEINRKFLPIIRDKLGIAGACKPLFEDRARVEIVERAAGAAAATAGPLATQKPRSRTRAPRRQVDSRDHTYGSVMRWGERDKARRQRLRPDGRPIEP